jgi:uncharacterized protein YbjQ (UPF0145 family)
MMSKGEMMMVTTECISGKETQMLGLVKGSTIQTVNAFKDIGAAFKETLNNNSVIQIPVS